MLRTQMVKSINNIIRAIQSSNLESAIKESTSRASASRGERQLNKKLLSALNNFSLEFKQFNEFEINLSEILSIKRFADPMTWEELVYPEEPAGIYNALGVLSFAINHLPLYIKLITPSNIEYKHDIKDVIISTEEGQSIFSVVLHDTKTFPFTTNRFIALFQSITSLYEVASSVLQEKPAPILLINCDSGDEKAFDFLGAAKIIQMIKEIVLSM